MVQNSIFCIQNFFSLSRSKRVEQDEKLDPITQQNGKIVECNGDKACGNKQFMAAVCAKEWSLGVCGLSE